MKKLLLLLLALALVVTGCKQSGGSDDDDASGTSGTGTSGTGTSGTTTGSGIPKKLNLTGVSGFFLSSGTSARSAMTVSRSCVSGGSVITGTDSVLCCVKATGDAVTAGFVDENNNTVSVSISKVTQLNDNYILLTYSYTPTGGTLTTATASLNITTGALETLSVVPDNWERIFSRGTMAWYESGGSLYKSDLSSGTCTAISTGAETYMNMGTSADLIDNGRTASWTSDIWIFADLNNAVYAFDGGYQDFRAQAIKSDGTIKNFGFENCSYTFFESLTMKNILWDESTGYFYTTRIRAIWDNNILSPGGMYETGGHAIQLYKAELNPDIDRVMTFTFNAYALAATRMSDDSVSGYCIIGFHNIMSKSIMTYGNRSFCTTPTSIIEYDTSSAPVDHTTSSGSNRNYVSNWLYSGNAVYAGPNSSTDSVSIMEFSGSTVNIATLLSGDNIVDWTVVGSVLFYTDTSGKTYKACIDTTACTCGTPVYYSDTKVVGITQ
jgi:hypothetical protein